MLLWATISERCVSLSLLSYSVNPKEATAHTNFFDMTEKKAKANKEQKPRNINLDRLFTAQIEVAEHISAPGEILEFFSVHYELDEAIAYAKDVSILLGRLSLMDEEGIHRNSIIESLNFMSGLISSLKMANPYRDNFV